MRDGVITEADTYRKFVIPSLMAKVMRLLGEIEASVAKVQA